MRKNGTNQQHITYPSSVYANRIGGFNRSLNPKACKEHASVRRDREEDSGQGERCLPGYPSVRIDVV